MTTTAKAHEQITRYRYTTTGDTVSNAQRRLTEDEQTTLAELNGAVAAALKQRREWLDAKMHETSRLQPGDEIYDVRTGRRLGTIRKLYRYQSDNYAGVYDTDVSCSYEYETSPRCFDNTSRQIGLWVGTRDDAAQYAEDRVSALRAPR